MQTSYSFEKEGGYLSFPEFEAEDKEKSLKTNYSSSKATEIWVRISLYFKEVERKGTHRKGVIQRERKGREDTYNVAQDGHYVEKKQGLRG